MRRVLVVDDDEVSREVLELLLGQEGFEVSTAESGDAAVARLKGRAGPEVVLADLQMPGLCGNALARELRALCGEETALLAMSGSEPAPEQVAEYDEFLLKPFAASEVTKALRWKAVGATTRQSVDLDQAAVEESKVLDATVFGGFAAMMRKEQLAELYGLCLRDAAKSSAEMTAAAGKKDDAEFRRAAHAMKGSFGMLGARELQGMCAVLERTGLSGDASMTSLDEITMAMGRLRRMLMARGVELPTESS